MTAKTKDVLNRALKTFIQATIASLIVNIESIMMSLQSLSLDTLKQVALPIIIGAIAAGISAAWNQIIAPWLNSQNKVEKLEGTDETAEDTRG